MLRFWRKNWPTEFELCWTAGSFLTSVGASSVVGEVVSVVSHFCSFSCWPDTNHAGLGLGVWSDLQWDEEIWAKERRCVTLPLHSPCRVCGDPNPCTTYGRCQLRLTEKGGTEGLHAPSPASPLSASPLHEIHGVYTCIYIAGWGLH